MNEHMTQEQFEKILKVLSNSPMYEAHVIEELKRALQLAYNPPCGLSTK